MDKFKRFMDYEPKIEKHQGALPEKELKPLVLKNVSFTYNGACEPSLKNVNMTINPYEKVAIEGYNGAGKTTLIKLLMRLYDPCEGEILIGDKNIKEFEKEGVDLSGGEKQKVAIARAFYKDSHYAVMDEPSSALDPVAEYRLNQNMVEIAKNRTVIFISHRLSTTVMADRIYMFEKGEIIEQGSLNFFDSAKCIGSLNFLLQK